MSHRLVYIIYMAKKVHVILTTVLITKVLSCYFLK